MKLDRDLTLKILSFVRDNSNDIYPIDVSDIADSLTDYSDDIIFDHVFNLCKAKYIISGQYASNMVLTVRGLYPKGENLINGLSFNL